MKTRTKEMTAGRRDDAIFVRCRFFTLIEIIVAMGVFSVVMAIAMQFFAGAQRVWSSSENRSNVYADARVAMNLMAAMLQSSYYANLPMLVVQNQTRRSEDDTSFDAVYFPVKSSLRPRGEKPLFAAAFMVPPECDRQKDAYNDLMIATVCDGDQNEAGEDCHAELFKKHKNAYVAFAIYLYNTAKEFVKYAADEGDDADDAKAESVVSHVTSFRITPAVSKITGDKHGYDSEDNFHWERSDYFASYCYPNYLQKERNAPRPLMIKIELGILPDPYFERWREAPTKSDKKKIKDEQEVKFTRIVYIGERDQI